MSDWTTDFDTAMQEDDGLTAEERALIEAAETDLENSGVELEDFDPDTPVETAEVAPIVESAEDEETPTPAPTTDKSRSKKEQALEIYNQLKDTHKRKDIIEQFMAQLGMSKAGASTYYQNCRTTWS